MGRGACVRFAAWVLVLVPLQGAAARCVAVCALELGCWCRCRASLPDVSLCADQTSSSSSALHAAFICALPCAPVLDRRCKNSVSFAPILATRKSGLGIQRGACGLTRKRKVSCCWHPWSSTGRPQLSRLKLLAGHWSCLVQWKWILISTLPWDISCTFFYCIHGRPCFLETIVGPLDAIRSTVPGLRTGQVRQRLWTFGAWRPRWRHLSGSFSSAS